MVDYQAIIGNYQDKPSGMIEAYHAGQREPSIRKGASMLLACVRVFPAILPALTN